MPLRHHNNADHDLFTTLLRQVQDIACHYALPYEEAQDCAIAFVEHLLQEEGEVSLREKLLHLPQGWWHRKLDRFLRTWQRSWRRRRSHEICFTEWKPRESLDREHSQRRETLCDASVLQEEFLAYLHEALSKLRAKPCELFQRHYFQGLSVSDLATLENKSPDAIRMQLKRACLRLRGLLEQQGLTEVEAKDYLALLKSAREWKDDFPR